MTLLIIVNFVILCLDRFPNNETEANTLSYINDFLTFCFLVEMVIRMLALGLKEYSADMFNVLDSLIVCISVIDMIISWTS
jgi:hypothetical protein